MRRELFIKEEGGFTTPAAAIALLLVLSLLFMCVDGYRVGTRSGQIQYVADAGALAADSVVAEFVTVGQVVDAVLLSFSLTIVTIYAVSAVCAFIPGADIVSGPLANAATKLLRIRNKFSKSAVKGLNAAQKALPALCAVRAAQVVRANAQLSGQDYVGIAITCPMTGVNEGILDTSKQAKSAQKKSNKDAKKAGEEIEKKGAKAQERANKMGEAQEEAEDAKREAWLVDCGSTTYNMRNRASNLANLSGAINPDYRTVDTWSFSVGLNRAKAYYSARYAQEPGAAYQGTTQAVVNSIARKKFYSYALSRVSEGKVTIESGVEHPDLKHLAVSKEEVKSTSLYTESIYPLSRKKEGDKPTLHAWTGCPGYSKGNPAGTGSVADIDSGRYQQCKVCGFSANSFWLAGFITNHSATGFEHWYERLVDASERYWKCQKKVAKKRAKQDTARGNIAEQLKTLIDAVKGQRYDPQPPGRYGCICIVYAPEKKHSSLPFLGKASTTPARVAISGATLAPDAASDQGTVVADVAKGLVPGDNVGTDAVHTLFWAWGVALKAYSDANSGLASIVRTALGKVPVVGNDLSNLAISSFQSVLDEAGLQPAQLQTYKPVLVNTSQVVDRLDEKNAIRIAVKGLKLGAEGYSAVEAGDLEALLDTLGVSPDLGGRLKDGKFTIATLSFSILGKNIGDAEITVPVPDNVQKLYDDAKSSILKLAKVG